MRNTKGSEEKQNCIHYEHTGLQLNLWCTATTTHPLHSPHNSPKSLESLLGLRHCFGKWWFFVEGLLYLDFIAFLPNISHIRRPKFTAFILLSRFWRLSTTLIAAWKGKSINCKPNHLLVTSHRNHFTLVECYHFSSQYITQVGVGLITFSSKTTSLDTLTELHM